MKILVPVDGSPASLRALKLAIDQVKGQVAASLIVLNVQNLSTLDLSESAGVMPPGWIEEEEKRASQAVLNVPQSICKQAGIPHSVRTERGAIAATIERVARAEHVDQIIMGTRGLGGIRGLLLGSVAMQVLHLVDVPLTLVKARLQ